MEIILVLIVGGVIYYFVKNRRSSSTRTPVRRPAVKPWQVLYEGTIASIGSGWARPGFTRRSHIDIDDMRVRNVLLTDTIDDLVSQAQGVAGVRLTLGHYLGYRWVLAIRAADGYVERVGFFTFFFHALILIPAAILILTSILSGILVAMNLAKIAFIISSIMLLVLIGTVILNVSAWLGHQL